VTNFRGSRVSALNWRAQLLEFVVGMSVSLHQLVQVPTIKKMWIWYSIPIFIMSPWIWTIQGLHSKHTFWRGSCHVVQLLMGDVYSWLSFITRFNIGFDLCMHASPSKSCSNGFDQLSHSMVWWLVSTNQSVGLETWRDHYLAVKGMHIMVAEYYCSKIIVVLEFSENFLEFLNCVSLCLD
jgi:hypothetical protein